MGYNGGNRHMRSSMFSKRSTKQGSKVIGDIITGLLGAGVIVGKGIGKGMEENAKTIKVKQKEKLKSQPPKITMNENDNEKDNNLYKWIGIVVFGIIAALLITFAGHLAIFLLLPFGLLSKR